jgi:hypothetical protein
VSDDRLKNGDQKICERQPFTISELLWNIHKFYTLLSMKLSQLGYATVLWERKGVLMVEFMQQVTTIKSEVYCETLCRAI